ncbi:MAG: twin-arginine translocase TatA/TatE family subunit [Candidatus Hydrogenedentes bacterium]|nr:twin-arginine translocase TatA/TatE family subunit [Candidatus Hydrogenedentota bacterium]
MFGMGPTELVLLLLLVLIVFGAGKLPQVGRSLGGAISEFKDSVKGKDEDEDEKPASSSTSSDASPKDDAE